MGTLWYGGTVYTMGNANDTVEAIYTEGSQIKAAGNEHDLRALYAAAISKEVNLERMTLLPGFTDSHLHLIGHGEKLMRLDFSAMESHKEIQEALVHKIEETPSGEWIIGEGWNENQLQEGYMFDRSVLDKMSSDHPIVLKRICRHAILVNSAALMAAGITEKTADPAGGIIERREDGSLTGLLLDRAQDIVLFETMPPVSKEYIKKALYLAVHDCFRHGLVGGHSEDLSYYGAMDLPIKAYQEVLSKELPFKAHLLIHHFVMDEFARKAIPENRYMEFGAIKIFADGSLGGRTALLSEPYLDEPDVSGVAVHTQSELNELVYKARKIGKEIAIHVIGDKAFEMALNAVKAHPPASGQKDRFIHAQILRPDLMERARYTPIILDIQPGFTASDFPWVIDRLGEERLTYSFAWKTLLDLGIPCAGGSDAPIEPINPLHGIHAAVTRKSIHTPDEPGYFMKEALSMYEAIRLYTAGSAKAIHKEAERGKIEAGYDADFTVLDHDPFQMENPDKLLETSVVMTIAEGEMVYRKKSSAE
ncbi:amidohydrolase [Bacillus sp. FJAT-42376]|uniref:amidohydrolase n=1 Tax=Bacillus sp. FJAT-42376 TaxID=2014076 RepID=UPI000F4F706D|nr:amidohydrolase [Bacillus sp. FJAT-42376]AZB43940.1 amidohydrolase [Bacillus sp. FJAT-42376]